MSHNLGKYKDIPGEVTYRQAPHAFEECRDYFKELYFSQGKPLNYVMDIFEKLGYHASKDQWRRRLNEWNKEWKLSKASPPSVLSVPEVVTAARKFGQRVRSSNSAGQADCASHAGGGSAQTHSNRTIATEESGERDNMAPYGYDVKESSEWNLQTTLAPPLAFEDSSADMETWSAQPPTSTEGHATFTEAWNRFKDDL